MNLLKDTQKPETGEQIGFIGGAFLEAKTVLCLS